MDRQKRAEQRQLQSLLEVEGVGVDALPIRELDGPYVLSSVSKKITARSRASIRAKANGDRHETTYLLTFLSFFFFLVLFVFSRF